MNPGRNKSIMQKRGLLGDAEEGHAERFDAGQGPEGSAR